MTCRYCILAALFIFLTACSKKDEKKIEKTPLIGYSIHSAIPHDTKSFTEGFTIHRGELYESTGLDDSWVGVVDIETGVPKKKIELESKYFGEGITILNGKLYHLTWKNHVGFVYALPSYKEIRQFTYKIEGWGLTHNGTNLIMSDGTDQLHFLDTVNLTVIKTIRVLEGKTPVQSLNELEFVDGYIYANIWQSDRIAKIEAETGKVVGYLDLSNVANQVRASSPNAEVLNGIAWHATTKSLLVTGKYWPFIYVLKLQGAN